MKMNHWFACVCLTLATGPAFAASPGCGMPNITGARELQKFLSMRAIEVIKLAASSNDGLAALVAPSASFDLGSGDVGRPLGEGVSGARALALEMHADTYRFLGWDYMDMPAAPCETNKVDIEFTDSQSKRVSLVTFTFNAGRMANATGRVRSFETGPL